MRKTFIYFNYDLSSNLSYDAVNNSEMGTCCIKIDNSSGCCVKFYGVAKPKRCGLINYENYL